MGLSPGKNIQGPLLPNPERGSGSDGLLMGTLVIKQRLEKTMHCILSLGQRETFPLMERTTCLDSEWEVGLLDMRDKWCPRMGVFGDQRPRT